MSRTYPKRLSAVIERLERRVLLAGDGLLATYFPSGLLSGPSTQHVDPQINFDWRHSTSVPQSMRWIGRVVAPVSGRYSLNTISTGLVRLSINGKMIINDWRDHRMKTDRATVNWVAGQSFPVELDWAKGQFPAFISWQWVRGRLTQIVPRQQLYSGLPATPIALDATGVSASEIDLSWQDGSVNASVYSVQRSSDGGQTFATIASTSAPVASYHDAALSAYTNYTYRVMASNPSGASAFTYPIIANTLSGFATTGHPPPTPVGWANNAGAWQFAQLPDKVQPDSEHPGNIFYVGAPIIFTLDPAIGTAPGAAKTYEVRDYNGNLVDSGTISHALDLTLAPQKPGWYKLYLYGAPSTANATFGDVVGGTTFSVFRNNPNLPGADWLRLGGYDFRPAFTRTDGNLNFTTAWAAGTPDATQIPAGPFAVRWTGQLRPTTSGTYTLTFNGSAGWVRLWLNGTALIDVTNIYETPQTTVQLQAGQAYDLRIDYYFIPQSAPAPAMVLSWAGGDSGLPTQPIPQAMLYSSASSQASSGDGLSPTYYKLLLGPEGDIDQVVRAITGMGPQRYQADASHPTATIAQLSAEIAFDSQYYTPLDPQRNRSLLISFGSGTAGYLSGVTQIVQQFQNQVEYWEPLNEPNYYFPYNGADFVPVMRDFYNTVKAVNPHLKVIGPNPVDINPYGLSWLEQFFAAGGGQYLDAFSFHSNNTVNRDLTLARENFAGLDSLLAKYGLGNIPLWQTEQGHMAAVYGDYEPQNQGEWDMFDMMVFEQKGIPKEHNVLWLDVNDGQWGFPVSWENGDGSLNPAAPLMRVWSEELYGTNFNRAYDFGPAGNNTYIGSLFTGPGKSVAAFVTDGATDGQVTLNVNGGASLHVVDAFGNASDISVVNGQATLGVALLPEYVELASGQTITVVPLNWGPDLATQPGVVALADGNGVNPVDPTIPNSIDKVHDGILQNWYYNFQPSTQPWMDNTPAGSQAWVELDLPSAQTIDHVVVRAPTPWQNQGAPLDYELQFQDASGRWVTIQHVQEDPKIFGVYTPGTATTVDSFYSERSIFIHNFAPIATSKIRLLVNQVTWGGGATKLAADAGGQTGPDQLTLQEIEVYGQ